MPFLSPTRPPADPTAEAAIVRLPPQPAHWPRHLAVVFAVGLLGVGVALALGHLPVAWVIAIITVLGAAAATTFGIRAQQRSQFMDGAIEAVSGSIGARMPSRELVRPSRWTGGWIGVPQRIQIRYAAIVNDTDPGFVESVLEHLRRRLGSQYRVRKHNVRRCVLLLEIDPTELAPKNPEVERAKKVVRDLLGAAPGKVSVETADDGTITAITVRDELGVRASMASYRARVDKALSSMLPGQWRSKWKLEEDQVRFEVRPAMPERILHPILPSYPAVDHRTYDGARIPIAVDEDGNEIVWQPSVSPHLLIVGGTGSGKTSGEHTIVTDLAMRLYRIWILDGKRIEFAGFRDWPNVELVASKVEHQVRMLHAAHDLMEQRYSLIESGKARISDFEPLFLVIDEYATFQARVERWYKSVKPKGGPTKAPVFDLIPDLARLARTAKIHMVLGIQRPDVTFLGGEMRDNFGARLSLGRLSPQGANMMWDSFGIGVAVPRNKRGRGVALNDDSNPVDVQTYFTPDPAKVTEDNVDDLAFLDRLRSVEVVHPRKMIIDPRPEVDGDKGVMLEPMYEEWASALIVPFDASRAEQQETATIVTDTTADLTTSTVRFVDEDAAATSSADELSDGDLFEGYSEPEEGIRVSELNPGDLVCVDSSLDLWGVVQGWEGDVTDDDNVAIDYLDFETGEPNMISVPEGERMNVRYPESK
ncbi:FtsK/SpoIIIE domain-containing protein [Curtobacterium flaccumfaciens pv. oortii]|uniref:FtsK/SpoIIIE domain-containing protein n=1 Tax=Curtobacterium flaccumfaciens TaxID=2035 RepID=UPI00265B429A|nr:FtsK/SpoIIIE domain-containing protein [Curtobacterium flaccumfaciens]MCS5524795.1 FtsK/SpoIIIE domain-containing protein [Curtobacterium flaccumfaciens pv. oortii]